LSSSWFKRAWTLQELLERFISFPRQVDKTGTCSESKGGFGSIAARLRVQVRSCGERIRTIEAQLIDSEGIILPSIVV
jgi:hypothetical protein